MVEMGEGEVWLLSRPAKRRPNQLAKGKRLPSILISGFVQSSWDAQWLGRMLIPTRWQEVRRVASRKKLFETVARIEP